MLYGNSTNNDDRSSWYKHHTCIQSGDSLAACILKQGDGAANYPWQPNRQLVRSAGVGCKESLITKKQFPVNRSGKGAGNDRPQDQGGVKGHEVALLDGARRAEESAGAGRSPWI